MTADGDDANGEERGDRTPQTELTLGGLLRNRLEAALVAAEAAAGDRPIVALDAGCGERTSLRSVRHRIGRLIGVDLHPPSGPGPDVDEFVIADLCTDPLPLAEGSVDLAVSTFTFEHFADPGAALRAIARCLAPGGRLVVVTVNRRHPFVAAYLALPSPLRNRLQGLVKARSADVHPLVGACNDPLAVRDALSEAGFAVETLDTVGHLATAWRRRWWSRILGRLGDRLAAPFPSRRSTIVAVARKADPIGTFEAEAAAQRPAQDPPPSLPQASRPPANVT